MSQIIDGLFRVIEEYVSGLPLRAEKLINQLPGAVLPPGGPTGSGYPPNPDAVTRVDVRKNSTGSVFSRRRLNLIEGSNVTLTVADDSGAEEVDITIAATGGGGSSLTIEEVDASPTVSATTLKFPNGTLGVVGTVATYTPASAGGAAINTGTDASKGTGTAGDLYLPNDGVTLYRSTGAAQIPWGPIYPLVDPNLQTWSWVNQGSAFVDSTKGGIYLEAPATGGHDYHMRVCAAPTPPYTITAMIVPNVAGQSTTWFGLCWRESSSGKIISWGYLFSGGTYLLVSKMTNETTFNSHYTINAVVVTPAPIFLRIADDGTDRTTSWSTDGQHFMSYAPNGNTDFMTADQVGFFVSPNNGTFAAGITVLSWEQT